MIRLSLSFIEQYLISFEICPERLGVGKVTEKIKLRAKGIFQVGIDTAQHEKTRYISFDAQVYVAVFGGIAARIRTKEIGFAYGIFSAHRSNAFSDGWY